MCALKKISNVIIYFLLFFCISCTTREEVELPDINTKSPSYEEILIKKELLKKQQKELLDNKKEDL